MQSDVLARSAHGEPVRDIQTRLLALGYDLSGDAIGTYGIHTEAAVTEFQSARGLRVDGICGPQTWASLVEAGYALGDRMIYLRTPPQRGDDVSELQRRLGTLGFDAGRVDGIFGARTAQALSDFQRNSGLTTDGICGPDTCAALDRIWREADAGRTVASVKEHDALVDAPRQLAGRRITVGETGDVPALAAALGRALGEAGAVVLVLHDPDESQHAATANSFAADAYLGLAVVDAPTCRAAYYATTGFESLGGGRLAARLVEELSPVAGVEGEATGMRLPILRETRMTAVVSEVGPPSLAVERAPAVVAAIRRACARWATEPVPESPERA